MRGAERFVITRAPRTDRPILALLGIGLVLTQTLAWLYAKRELPLVPTVFWTLFVVWIDVQLFRWGRWLKAYDRLELEVDDTGITVVNAKETKVFPWRELGAVAFAVDVPFSAPTLVIEPASLGSPGLPKRFVREWTGRVRGATCVPLGHLRPHRPPGAPADPAPAGDLAVLAEAIRQHSDGRFPLPNRTIMPRHTPQT